MGNKQQVPFVNVGITSLVTTFLVLCLVIFAALSVTTAKSDENYSQRMAERRTEFYDACNRAEMFLHELDKALSKGENPDFFTMNAELDGDILTWQTPVNGSQALYLELRLTPNSEHSYETISYMIITTAEPGGEEPLPVMQIGGE